MIIVISGPPGSGKTSVAKELSRRLNIPYISAGGLFRKIAEEKGISVVELNILAEKNFEIDRLVDSEIINTVKKFNDVIVESHIAGWILNDVADVKVYLYAPFYIRAKRISERDKISLQRAMEEIVAREYSHYTRFKKYYGIDILDVSNFDLIINTENLNLNAIIDLLVSFIRNKQEHIQNRVSTL
ncbi:MAG: AAA family ATPase [Sulfolobaceae archaeon]